MTKQKIKSVKTPTLDHDKFMLSRFGTFVSPTGKLERRIVANLIAHVIEAGFIPTEVYDGDEFVQITSKNKIKGAMEIIFNLDEASLRIAKDGVEHGILLGMGNGIDIICDWSYSLGDADGFNKLMASFDAENFA